jgi:hypothetical protein
MRGRGAHATFLWASALGYHKLQMKISDATRDWVLRLVPTTLSATLFLVCGCASQSHVPGGAIQSPAFDIAPSQMAKDVKQIVSTPPISLPYEDEQDGQIVTGWQPFRGEFHIARFWYERTRYHITVIPDFNDPSHRSRIQVADETQQRPEESGFNQEAQRWSAAPDLHRSDRSTALLQQVETQLSVHR